MIQRVGITYLRVGMNGVNIGTAHEKEETAGVKVGIYDASIKNLD